MKTITMVEFRQNAPAILRGLKRSGEILITHRGKPAAKLCPPDEGAAAPSGEERDSFYTMCDLAREMADPNEPMRTTSLTNEEIDRLVYGI